jgi:hypothetical protein
MVNPIEMESWNGGADGTREQRGTGNPGSYIARHQVPRDIREIRGGKGRERGKGSISMLNLGLLPRFRTGVEPEQTERQGKGASMEKTYLETCMEAAEPQMEAAKAKAVAHNHLRLAVRKLNNMSRKFPDACPKALDAALLALAAQSLLIGDKKGAEGALNLYNKRNGA